MNYMPEVLKMLRVEVDERFNAIGWVKNPHHFNEKFDLYNEYGYRISYEDVVMILKGEVEIEKLPWKPKEDDLFFVVDSIGDTHKYYFNASAYDYYCYNAGNCFRTAEEITLEIKQRILQEMKGKYEND